MSARTQGLRLALLTMAALALGLRAPIANADTIYVPDDYPAIQEALFVAHDGDTIVVRDGVYTGLWNKDIDFGGLGVTLRSENGPENCIIDCENDGRGFIFRLGEGPDSVVDGFTITNGSAGSGGGGGILCENGSSPTIGNCTFSGNWADYGGGAGGVRCEYSSPTITNCTFSGNGASSGGGVYCFGHSPTITNCTFSGNSADPNGGSGGGIYSCSVLSIVNCVLWGDTAPNGPELCVGGAMTTIAFSDVEGGWAWIHGDAFDWAEGNIVADPLFADPDNSDYHLSADSPCVETGDPDFVPEPDERDIDGQMRVWDGDDDGEWIVDMGSDEFGSKAPGDLDGDGCVGHGDLGMLLADWGCSGGDCPGDCHFDGDTDHADLGVLLGHWGEGCP